MTNTEPAVETKRTQRPRDVDYTLELIDGDIPDMEVTRKSPLEDQLAKVQADEKFHGKWVRIGSYSVNSAGTAAANVLRKRHGDSAAVEGWTFKPKRQEDNRTALFVKYEPGAIVEGAKADWEAKRKAAKEAAKAAKANPKPTEDAVVPGGQTSREQAKGPGQTSGTAAAASAKAPK